MTDTPTLPRQPLIAAATALGETVARVDAERAARARTPLVHHFPSTTDALDAIDADRLTDGDAIVVEAEGVVGMVIVAWAVAITEETGAFRPYSILRAPGRDYAGGAWTRTVDVAEETARQLGYRLGEPGGFRRGDRALCSDDRVRTVAKVKEKASRTPEFAGDPDASTWVFMDDGTAHRLETCEKVDRQRIAKARRAADEAAARVCRKPDPEDPAWLAVVDELTQAMTYLRKTDPEAAADLAETGRQRRLTMEIPRSLLAPGDVLHELGARLEVRDTGVSDAEPGGVCQWWAELLGVTEADRRATFRQAWTISLPLGQAAWDVVTVERMIPCLTA